MRECPICLGVEDPFLDGLPCDACGGTGKTEPRMSPEDFDHHMRCLEEPMFEVSVRFLLFQKLAASSAVFGKAA